MKDIAENKKVYCVSRHQGAIDWIFSQGVEVHKVMPHLRKEEVVAGDVFIGTLPIQLAAYVCMRGADYLHLSLDIPAQYRGVELSMEQVMECNPSLERFSISYLPA